MEEIAQNVDRNIALANGQVLLSGTPREVFSCGEQLMRAGLDVPQVTRVAMALQRRGVAVGPAVYTVDELASALLRLKRGGAANA